MDSEDKENTLVGTPPPNQFHDYATKEPEISAEEKLHLANEYICKLEEKIGLLEAYQFGTSSLKACPEQMKFYTEFESYEMQKATFPA